MWRTNEALFRENGSYLQVEKDEHPYWLSNAEWSALKRQKHIQ